MPAIRYAQFIHPVTSSSGEIGYYSRDKHGTGEHRVIRRIEQEGSWIILTGRDERKRHIPMTNVAYIEYEAEAPPPEKKK